MATPKKKKTPPPATVQNFPIVGIGASAGGLDAFKRFLTAVPETSGMAYVLVQHLDPSHESFLPEILQRVTKIPVHEITEDIHLAPDHIYVIPPNKMLMSTDGVLKLTDREEKINLSIDVFFTSLADVHKEFAVGVVLSGTGSDGTLGLKAIKEHGGISIVQDSESAAYDSMPQSAVNAGVVDFILAPEKIPAQLLEINSAYKTSHFFKEEEELPKDDESAFKQILLLLRQRRGVDFTYYKQPTFHRRIARRIAIAKKKNIADYLKFLRTDKAEQDALFLDVLIPVTSFFRDPKTFQALAETVFPAIIKNKSDDELIRIWIAGCSTGEEAFSVAICLHEFLTRSKRDGAKIQLFASDISERAIKKARLAVYAKGEVEVLPASQVKKYFVKNIHGYEVCKLIRDMCVFAPHNFLKDPPFARMDLISCRNVLIYMDTFLQKKAFTTFHYALKENGFLLLGKSETTGASSDLFTQVGKHEKIYSRKSVPGRFIHLAERSEVASVTKDPAKEGAGKTEAKREAVYTDFRRNAEEVMILKSPASVVVNQQMDIVHIHGSIDPFLEAPQGKPTHNLIKMAREGLAFELRNALHKAMKERTSVIKADILVKTKGDHSLVTLEIIPLTDTIEPHYLIRFEKKIVPIVEEEQQSLSGNARETSRKLSGQNQELEKQLSQSREDMRSITEDMEATNEELQSANEELQSSNEEMQSLNEELETSKEELQSTNEELVIVNQEMLDKQEQLNVSLAFQVEARKLIEVSEMRLRNILEQAPDPILILKGENMILDTANQALYDLWRVDKNAIGKGFLEILPEMKNQGFFEMLQDVYFNDKVIKAIDTMAEFIRKNGEKEIIYFNFVFHPYREVDGKISGVLIIASDVTKQVFAKRQLEESETFNRTILESSPDCLNVLDGEGRIQFMNFSGLCQMEIDDFSAVKNKYWWTLWGSENEALVKESVDKASKGDTVNFTAICPTAKGTAKWWNVVISPVVKPGEPVRQIISVSRDITQQKEAEEKIRQSEQLFKSIFENSLAAIVITDDQGNYLSANEAAGELFEYTVNELLQMNVGDLKTHAKNGAAERFEQYMDKGEEAGEFDFTTKNGDHKFVQYQAIRIKADFHLSIMMDITKQKSFSDELEGRVVERTKEVAKGTQQVKEVNQSLELKNRELENANAELNSFTYIASHDLQEPLRKIQAFSKIIIEENVFSDKTHDYFNRIVSAAQRMQNLIVALLDFSRAAEGGFVMVPCDLNKIVADLKSELALGISEKETIIEWEDLPTVNGLPVQLSQLFANLFGNAIKYSRPEVIPHIKITAERIDGNAIAHPAANKQQAYYAIRIADNGIGFEKEYATKIFELFQRLHGRNEYSGTGIGLAIVKKIATNHTGFIVAEGKPNVGSTFILYLPTQ